jgi:translocation and assembly module TamB
MVPPPVADPPSPAPVGRHARRSRRVRLLRIAALGLVVLALVGVAAFTWLGSGAMLRLLAERAAIATDGRLSIESPEGSLLGTIRAKRLVWHDGPLTVAVDDAVLSVRWLALAQRRLALGGLSAAHVEVVTDPASSPGAPAAPPASLRLPIGLELPDLRIGGLTVREVGSDTPLVLEDLHAALRYDRRTWTLERLGLRGPFGTVGAGATLGDTAPYPLDGHALLETTVLGDAVAIDARFDGTLTALGASARAVLRDASVSARARLAPFAPVPLAGVSLVLTGLDLARFGDGLPATRLEASLEAEAPADAPPDAAPLPPLAGTLRLRNGLPGPVDAGRLPVETLEAGFSTRGERLGIERLVIAGPPGRLAGTASLRLAATVAPGAAGMAGPTGTTGTAGVQRGAGPAPAPPPGRTAWPAFELSLATERLDLRRVHAALRETALRGSVQVRPQGAGLAFDARLADGEVALEASARWVDDLLTIGRARLQARDGVATFEGRAGTAAPFAFELSGTLAGLDPSRFADLPPGRLNGTWQAGGSIVPRPDVRASLRLADSRWRGMPLSGAVTGRYAPDRLSEVDATLRLGGTALVARGDLGAIGDRLGVDLQASRLQELDARLAGRLVVQGELRDRLLAPGIDASVTGSGLAFEERLRMRRLQAGIEVERLDALLVALVKAGVPGLPDAAALQARAATPPPAGTTRRAPAGVRGAVRGTAPAVPGDTVGLTVRAEGLQIDGTTVDALRAELTGDAARHALAVQAQSRSLGLDARVRIEGGFTPGLDGRWAGRLVEAGNARGPVVRLLGPAELRLGSDGVSAAQLVLEVDGPDGGRVRLDRAAFVDGRMQLQGALERLPIRWLAEVGVGRGLRLDEPDALRLGARIDLSGLPGPGGGLQGRVEVFRESGDLTVEVPAAEGGTELIRAGLQAAELRIELGDGQARATASVRGTALGTLRADAQVPIAWADGATRPRLDVPLTGRLELDVPSLAFTRALAGEAWLFDGALQARIALGGTLATPDLTGSVTGTRLVAEQRELGMRLTDGELRAVLRGGFVEIETLRFASGAGSVSMTGALRPDEASEAVLVLDRMPIPLGAGQRLILSGEARASLSSGLLRLRGRLRADEGVIELTAGNVPRLAKDVVVVRDTAEAERRRLETARRLARPPGAPARPGDAPAGDRPGAAAEASAPERGFRIRSNLEIDLGDRFRVWGAGVDARLAGQLTLRGRLPDAPIMTGTVRIVEGTYTGFGQRLEIEKGTLVFSGPVDNPAIDIVAYRRYLPVEAGVALTGTARNPRLALVSKPDVPEQDKLSWLVLGVGADTARSGGQSAALQTAAATLLATADPAFAGPGIASTFGLDVLSIRTGQVGSSGDSGSTAASAQDSIVTLGKRLSQRLFVSYEQSLRGLQNLLRLQYEVTDRLQLRTKVGTENAVDLLWTYRYD